MTQTTEEFHLPEAILGHGIPKGEVKIGLIFGIDMWHAISVPDDLHIFFQTRKRNFS